MSKLSTIIIAKNAEKIIKDCLKSVDFADETIVVDGGSIDKTNEIAKKYNARIVKSIGTDFAQKRNVGLKEARNEWILYVDTDERVSEDLKKNIQRVISKNLEVGAYSVKRKNFYLGNHAWPKIEKLERLFRKNALLGWFGKLHETPKFTGKLGLLDGYLYHYTHQDLEGMLDKTIEWSAIEAQLRVDAHHPKMSWWRFIRVMATGFGNSYFTQGGWRVGTVGLIESIYQSYSMFITYARLWELQQDIKNNELAKG